MFFVIKKILNHIISFSFYGEIINDDWREYDFISTTFSSFFCTYIIFDSVIDDIIDVEKENKSKQ